MHLLSLCVLFLTWILTCMDKTWVAVWFVIIFLMKQSDYNRLVYTYGKFYKVICLRLLPDKCHWFLNFTLCLNEWKNLMIHLTFINAINIPSVLTSHFEYCLWGVYYLVIYPVHVVVTWQIIGYWYLRGWGQRRMRGVGVG